MVLKKNDNEKSFFGNWNISFQFQSERAWFALFTIFLCVIKTLKYCAAPDAAKLIGQSLLFTIKETLDHDIYQLNFRLYNVHNWSSFHFSGNQRRYKHNLIYPTSTKAIDNE